jgi:hypothetical protein
MIQDEKIKNMVFLEQTTYYIYRSEEDRKNGIAFLTTSDKNKYEQYKEAALAGNWEVKERKNEN